MRLNPQDGLYTVLVKDGDERRALRVIGSVARGDRCAASEREALLGRDGRPGDAHRVADGDREGLLLQRRDGRARRWRHPDIVADLAHPQRAGDGAGTDRRGAAATARGGDRAVHGAELRQPSAQWAGRRKRVLTEFAEAVDAGLGRWVRGDCAVPAHDDRPHRAGDDRRRPRRSRRRCSASRMPGRWWASRSCNG